MGKLVVCVRGFSGLANGDSVTHYEGQVFELPDGVDWEPAGFVLPLQPEAEATADPADDKTAEVQKAKA